MGVKWKNDRDITVVVEYIEGKKRETVNNVIDIINEELDDAVEKMVTGIETVPSGIVPDKVGRVDTGHMRDSVGADRMKKSGPNRWTAKFGWTIDQEDYFGYQEYGTGDKSGGRRNISPMHVFTGAKLELFEKLKARIP